MSKPVVTTIKSCARCGMDHPFLELKKFKEPAGDHTHFGMCPTLYEPILAKVTDEPEKDQMKLFKVKVVFETVLCANTPEDALKNAEYTVRNEATDEPACEVSCELLEDISDLPEGWTDLCIPYGGEESKFIHQFLKN